MSEATWRRIAELWLSGDWSIVDIRQEIGNVTMDQVETAVRQIDFVSILTAEHIRQGIESVMKEYEMTPSYKKLVTSV